MKPEIRLTTVNYFDNFKKNNHRIFSVLEDHYSLIWDDNDPDFVLYGGEGNREEYLKYDRAVKVFYTHELEPWNDFYFFEDADYSFSSHLRPNDDTHFRYPLFAFFAGGISDDLFDIARARYSAKEKTKFCCFLVSNSTGQERNYLFRKLSRYKQVDSGGEAFNNLNGWTVPWNLSAVLDWISEYKFMITFENKWWPGYTSEKIYNAFRANTIPIYWGNPQVHEDFDPRSFINVFDYRSFDDVVEKVIELDLDMEKYMDVLSRPVVPGNKMPVEWSYEHFKNDVLTVFDPDNIRVLEE